jgi:hypothetical protein
MENSDLNFSKILAIIFERFARSRIYPYVVTTVLVRQ